MDNWRILWQLYAAFFRIGGLTFGGGLAMLPMLKYELVEKKKWLTEDALLDCYAIGQCTPGIIAVNTATFVGYRKRGVAGGVIATLGMVTPSLVIITLVAACLENFMDNVWLQHALMGVRGIVCALMLNTVINLARKSLTDVFACAVCGIVLAVCLFTEMPAIVIVAASAAVGILLEHFGKHSRRDGV